MNEIILINEIILPYMKVASGLFYDKPIEASLFFFFFFKGGFLANGRGCHFFSSE